MLECHKFFDGDSNNVQEWKTTKINKYFLNSLTFDRIMLQKSFKYEKRSKFREEFISEVVFQVNPTNKL